VSGVVAGGLEASGARFGLLVDESAESATLRDPDLKFVDQKTPPPYCGAA
jgi:hypothetical protein